jgi:hypothetical protein
VRLSKNNRRDILPATYPLILKMLVLDFNLTILKPINTRGFSCQPKPRGTIYSVFCASGSPAFVLERFFLTSNILFSH